MGDGQPPIGIACDTLRDLAFRMHLLAVNAGAVAARSHDEDEGSVAVADGVRDLADRSRDAVNQLERINRWSTELAETAEELALQLEEPLPTSSLAPQATQPLQSSSLEVARQALSELGGTLHASANHADTSSMRSRRLTHRAQELRRAAGHFRVSDRTAVLHQLPVPSQTGPHEVPTPTLKPAVGGGASDPGPTTESFEERFASKPHSV
jgi:methyl-accepting chemotaxis protein